MVALKIFIEQMYLIVLKDNVDGKCLRKNFVNVTIENRLLCLEFVVPDIR